MEQIDIVIIGAGTAGLTAAIYACRSGLSCVVLEENMYGGQIVNTGEIENYPGMPGVTGFDFANALHRQAEALGAKSQCAPVSAISKSDPWFYVETPSATWIAKAVIAATGAVHRKLGCEGEERLTGMGVSYCATCDGAFFKGKSVAVVGGGNTAAEDALYLSGICREVHLIHRRDQFRAHQATVRRLLAAPNVTPHYQATVQQITGDKRVEGILLSSPNGEQRLEVQGVFVAIGLSPNNQLFAPLCRLDEGGYFAAGEDCRTTCDGLFAAGDTRAKPLRQLVTAAADGAVAASMAAVYVGERIKS